MTRKDFVLIAQTIRWSRLSPQDRLLVAEDFARSLASTNPQFDNARFMRAATEEGK